MGKELVLPKNIRQIGDIQGKEKIFLEDYVMTYIKKKEKQEGEGYLGIFLGERQEKEDTVYVFIRGILEVPAVKTADDEGKDGHWKVRTAADEKDEQGTAREANAHKKNAGSEEEGSKEQKQAKNTSVWTEQMEKEYQEYFSDSFVQGCCVIGAYPTERMRQLLDALPEAGSLIYHLQEQEETLYQIENNRYRQIKGYFVFYEQNRKMQEYMAHVFQEDRVEKEGVSDKAIRSFRKKVKEKGIQQNTSFLKLASSFFVVTVLVLGVIVVNRIEEIRDVQSTVGLEDKTAENEILYIEDEPKETVLSQQAASVLSDSGIMNRDTEDKEETASQQETLAGSDTFWNEISAEDQQVNAVSQISTEIQINTEVSENETAIGSSAQIQTEAATSSSAQIQTEAATGSSAQMQTGTEIGSIAQMQTDTEAVQEAASMRQLQAAYVIREGDTLAEICSRYYGSLDRLAEICELNEITDADKIMPGQKIVLP